MTEILAIGWFVTPTINELISKIRSYLSTHYHMQENIEKLENTMMQIHVVVSNIEKQQITDSNQAILLQYMKEALYQAEDVLDEFDYLLLKEKIERKKNAKSLVPSSVGLDSFLGNLRQVLKRLENVKFNGEVFTVVEQPEIMPWRLSGCFPSEDLFIGRDKECKKIVKTLVESSGNEAKSSKKCSGPIILSIVGDGGVGKTTIAQYIYNDRVIAYKFDVRIWICVSNTFDEMKLTKEILESASKTKNNYDITNFNFSKLQEELQTKLESKKYFLVLDDVWDDHKMGKTEIKDRWMKFLAPLKCNQMGSAILVTTRVGLMAKMLCSKEIKPFYLKGLDHNDSWQLLSSRVFPPDTVDTPQMKVLRSIGEKIVEKLKGLPLALKVVGEQLNGNYNVGEWEMVLRNDLSDDIIKVLNLSYEHLPRQLQRCFAYCSIFPKGWRFELNQLVHMWIAQGFIYSQDGSNATKEKIGQGYFADLCNRSFFQTLKCDDRTYYVMHDMMNDLALSISRADCCRIESDDYGKIPSTVRHVSIAVNLADRLESIVEMKNLRTLILFNPADWMKVSVYAPNEDKFKNLKCVRVLVLTAHCMKELQTIDSLIHLRYLAVSINSEKSLDALCSLYHLEVLHIYPEFSSPDRPHVIFPKKMYKLINIQHVYLNGAIGEFHVQKKDGKKFGVLKYIEALHGDIIIKSLENIEGANEACETRLKSKEHINELFLEWSSSGHRKSGSSRVLAEILDNLQPHQNLSMLGIKGYGGSRSPSWLERDWLYKLHSLYLESWKEWRELPSLGHLPFLKILHIKSMHAVTRIGSKFYGSGEVKGFPTLEELLFEDMPIWKNWNGLRGTQLFPSLHLLKIVKCQKLINMPAFSLPLVESVKISSSFNKETSVRAQSRGLFFDSIKYLTTMDPYNREAIKKLKIIECTDPMPVKGLRELISLKELKISSCNQLLSSMNRGDEDENVADFFPQSLESLGIEYCEVKPVILSKCFRNLIALSNLEIRHLNSRLPWELNFQHLTGLVKLDISFCTNLRRIMGIEALMSLNQSVIRILPQSCHLN